VSEQIGGRVWGDWGFGCSFFVFLSNDVVGAILRDYFFFFFLEKYIY
jgi:hypothetical protein